MPVAAEPKVEKDTLHVGELRFDVRRSDARRTVGITVDRDGSLILRLPAGCPLEEGRAFAEEKRFWVWKKLARKKLLRRPTRPRRYVHGESFYYLGRSHRLEVVDAPATQADLRLYRGRFELRAGVQDDGERLFREWYTSCGQSYIERRVGRYRERLKVRPAEVGVRPLGYRWGSCGPTRRLNFHWRAVLLPRRLIDYIVVHELAHVHEPSHSQAFWRRVERAMPDYRERREELAQDGALYY
jgi:predicted metal-dependent hydrolase